jgi:hypothetical protein
MTHLAITAPAHPGRLRRERACVREEVTRPPWMPAECTEDARAKATNQGRHQPRCGVEDCDRSVPNSETPRTADPKPRRRGGQVIDAVGVCASLVGYESCTLTMNRLSWGATRAGVLKPADQAEARATQKLADHRTVGAMPTLRRARDPSISGFRPPPGRGIPSDAAGCSSSRSAAPRGSSCAPSRSLDAPPRSRRARSHAPQLQPTAASAGLQKPRQPQTALGARPRPPTSGFHGRQHRSSRIREIGYCQTQRGRGSSRRRTAPRPVHGRSLQEFVQMRWKRMSRPYVRIWSMLFPKIMSAWRPSPRCSSANVRYSRSTSGTASAVG